MTSAEITQADKELIWHPFTPLINPFGHIPIQSAKEARLLTADGKTIIDAVSSWWVNIHGHANEHIANAIHEQALKLEHVIFAGFTHEPAVRLAKNLMTILPENYSKVFFSDKDVYKRQGKNIVINWYYNIEDEDALEHGYDIAKLSGVELNLVGV